MSQLPPVLLIPFMSPYLDSGSAMASSALSKELLCASVCICADSWLFYFVCFLNPRRLEVAVKDMTTQLCQWNHREQENKFS